MHKLLWVLGLLMAAPVEAAPTVRQISFAIWHEADGKKYPNQVKESYTLGADGVLSYSAYFGGMPTEMNHMDDVDWKSGAVGKQALAVALSLVADKTAGVDEKAEDNSSEVTHAYVYFVGLTRNDVDSDAVIKDPKSPAYRRLHAAIAKLLVAFEKATHRPFTVGKLPQ